MKVVAVGRWEPGGFRQLTGNWQVVTNLPVALHLLNRWVGYYRVSSFQVRAAKRK